MLSTFKSNLYHLLSVARVISLQDMPSRRQKNRLRRSREVLLLLFELNKILVILRCDDRRTTGHENVCRRFFFQETYADFFLNRYK